MLLLLGPLWLQEVWDRRESDSATAFKHYLPVRSERDGLFSLYRSFTFGDMATIVLPETRSAVCGATVLVQCLLGSVHLAANAREEA